VFSLTGFDLHFVAYLSQKRCSQVISTGYNRRSMRVLHLSST